MKAFPHKVYIDTIDPTVQNPIIHEGMDLRDYFAAKAMQGMLRAPEHMTGDLRSICQIAYFYADGMMKAREQ
jgi:hypothetical protein